MAVVDFPRAPSGYEARADQEPVPAVIARLRELLAMAESGKLRSFAAVTIEGPGVIGQCWAETDGWYHEITSALATLQFRWMCENSGYAPTAGRNPGA